ARRNRPRARARVGRGSRAEARRLRDPTRGRSAIFRQRKQTSANDSLKRVGHILIPNLMPAFTPLCTGMPPRVRDRFLTQIFLAFDGFILSPLSVGQARR